LTATVRDTMPATISREAARNALLLAQGIEGCRPKPTKAGVLDAIRRMGQLQIDTIHVVARSPYFVLWTRLGDYDSGWLDELLAEQRIYEAWSHEACFLPIDDFPLTRARISSPITWRKGFFAILDRHREEADRLLDYIRQNGEVRSADFADGRDNRGGWWDWKLEKTLLEALFTEGSLMVARRERFQRVYDLRERVLPDWDDARAPSHEAMVRAHVLHSVRALGVAAASWIPDYYRFKKTEAIPVVQQLAEEGALLETAIEGVKGPAYVHLENAGLVVAAARGELQPVRTTLLSPFDPVVWHRQRGEELFDFSYRIECYTPAPKRVYGYFSLPILHRGALVGRLDAKAHRKEGTFEVRALHLETGVQPDEELATALAGAVRECACWHRTPKVVIRTSAPRGFAPQLRAALKAR
jgi:uncharacterized protein YcaQ